MHASRVLHKLLSSALNRIDRRNVRTLLSAVEACLRGRRLVLMELARHWPGARKVWAPLKRLDRLLSNNEVQQARSTLYRAAVALIVRCPEPLIVVDWSELKADGCWHLLRAALILRGRSLTVYEEVHPQRLLGARTVHRQFLRRLSGVLPEGVRPVVITDAGFKVPWFKQVQALDWHWIGRVGGRVSLREVACEAAAFRRVQDWYPQARPKARGLGRMLLTAYHRLPCLAMVIRKPPKGRHQTLTRSSHRAQSGKAEYMARGGDEPWFLVYSESLSNLSANRIARIYAKRMQIESAFRDLKSHRYGAVFEDTQTRSAKRLEILLLIHMLATLLAWIAALNTINEHERRFRLLIIDDIGYVKRSEAETSVLFELIAHRYEANSVLITSNQPFSAWDSVFPDDMMAVAAIDRLIHHAHVFELSGESYRKRTYNQQHGEATSDTDVN